LTGATVLGFRRRGKYIFMRLHTGVSVLIHLGMSGRMIIDAPFALHEHLTLETNEGCRIGFVDPRRFGALDLIAAHDEDSHRLVAELGPEPLGNEFNAPMLLAALAGRKNPIKAALLDQTLVAGIGNIYASEALFRAGISPRRLAGALGPKRVDRLVPAIKTTLTEAIAAGGSSLRDYVQPSGELGYFQHAWKVYDRAGQFCERCPQLPACSGIRRIVQTGRASFYCPQTQG
jgi:formamidopyrimidine-DNA glycosylase